MTQEQLLWQSVLLKAVMDATWPNPIDRDSIREKRAADVWIRSGGRDFKRVCTWAGMDWQFIRDAYVNGRIDGELLHMKERARG